MEDPAKRMKVEINVHEDRVKSFYSDTEILKRKIKEQNQMLKDAYENDAEYQKINEEIKKLKRQQKGIKDKIEQEPAVALIKSKVAGLKENLKDTQQGLFDHLETWIDQTGNRMIEINGDLKRIVTKYSFTKDGK